MRTTIGYILALSWLSACSSSGGEGAGASGTPYRLGQALVIGDGPESELTSVDEGCDSAACAAVRERCGEHAYADVVLGEDGEVLDVLCFRGNATVRQLGDVPVATAAAGNNEVLVLDAEDDGLDVTGDVVLTGNNAVLYGDGADVSRVGGTLAIEKNNAIVRGVSIAGDVTIDKNNAQLSFTEILGDLTISGNNTTLAECVVHGQIVLEGVNTVLVNNRLAGARSLAGKNLSCNGNVAFEPGAADVVDAGSAEGADAGAAPSPISCRDLKGPPVARGRR